MAKRGPKSAAESAVVVQGTFGNRPKPPAELSEAEADAWREVVASEPADFFSTAALRGLLVDYCRHRGTAEMLNGLIQSFKPEWLKASEGAKRYKELLKMRENETRAAAAMATKLRLTNQSRYTPQAASTASRNTAKGFKPWEL
jgi:hypothetical protein